MPEKNGTNDQPVEIAPLVINGKEILPGDDRIVQINAGKLPSGTPIDISLHVYRSKRPGPVMLVLGGVHGDEINGVEIVRRAVELGYFRKLRKGSVIAIPLLNVYGFINFSREVPDGKDVNRSFPGNMRGSLASRVARILTKRVLPVVDVVLDFHTGGASRYNHPQVRYTRGDSKSLKLARSFNAPFIIRKPLVVRSLRKVAKELKIPILVYEGGESTRLDGLAIERGLHGLRNVMINQKMIRGKSVAYSKSILIEKTTWVRASHSGIFIWSKKSGSIVRKGEPLGVISDPYGSRRVVVIATRAGYILGHNNASVVNQGDALFNIGYQFVLPEED